MSNCPDSLRCIFDDYDPMLDECWCINCGNSYSEMHRQVVKSSPKYWKAQYFINKENRYGFIEFWASNPRKYLNEIEQEDPDISFDRYYELNREHPVSNDKKTS